MVIRTPDLFLPWTQVPSEGVGHRPDVVDDGCGVWTVSGWPGRVFTRNQAITAMLLAERLAAGFGDDDPFVTGWREELAR